MIFPITVAVFIIVALSLPFFLAGDDKLQEGASVNSIEQLDRIKESLLKRYLEDEKAHQNSLISDSVWRNRQQFLTVRYLDASRRQDFLNHLKGLNDAK